MVRLVNGQWQPLPPIPEPDQGGIITDIIKFQGKLIAVGGIYIGNQDGIAYLDGEQWHILGPGLEAGFSSIHSMAVFQDQLYVGGQLAITTGNPGKDIMRWDGTQFHALGTGLERALGDQSTFTDCRALTVHNNLLYAGGGFRYAGGVAAKGVASWDVMQWCGVPGNLTVPTGGVTEIAFFQDTMFVICGYLADGDSVGMAAKFIGESYIDSCSGPVGLVEPNSAEAQDVFAHFSPAGTITAFGLPVGTTTVQLFDLQGRAMHVGRLNVGADGTAILHPGPLPPGHYVLHIGGHAVPIPNTP